MFYYCQTVLECVQGLQPIDNTEKLGWFLTFIFIVQEHVWDQLFTVDTIWNIGETGDI